jgi:integrase
VFPARAGGALSDMTISKIMRADKLPYVPHGFRSSFRDWAAELMPNIPDPVAEAALAHAIPDKVVSAYKRTAFLEMRRELLDAWGVYLEGQSNVLPLWGAAK